VAVSLCAAQAAQARLPTLGFADPLYSSGDLGERRTWLNRSVDAGARIVRLTVGWSAIAPASPRQGFNAADPSDSAYDFSGLDAAVRDASDKGLRVLLTLQSAPAWAEGRRRRRSAPPGTWKPDRRAYGRFAGAVAERYSGRFADPARPGSALPRVRYFQAWNEPNLPSYLNPQWVGGRAASPGIYRRLLNALYNAVKSVHASNKVVSAGTAPYGDDPGRRGRMRPVRFWRVLLCLRGRGLRPVRCPRPARLDVVAHHPINAFAPRLHAYYPDDATTPDLGRITRVVRKARRTGGLRPRGKKPIWATELWWDTRPPDPGGIRLRKQARWYRQSLRLLGRQGASVVILLQIRDSPPVGGYRNSSQSGLFFVGGRPKPSYRAVRSLVRGSR
jgi:hypothetical protein